MTSQSTSQKSGSTSQITSNGQPNAGPSDNASRSAREDDMIPYNSEPFLKQSEKISNDTKSGSKKSANFFDKCLEAFKKDDEEKKQRKKKLEKEKQHLAEVEADKQKERYKYGFTGSSPTPQTPQMHPGSVTEARRNMMGGQ